MLETLVESRDHKREHRTLGGFMATTAFAVVTLLTAGVIYSLFSQTVVLGADGLEISTLVAPVAVDPEPLPVEQPKPAEKPVQAESPSKLPTRAENIQRPEETPVAVPDKISVTPSQVKARPLGTFIIADRDYDPPAGSGPASAASNTPGRGLSSGTPEPGASRPVAVEEPPKVEQPPAVKPPPIVSGGVVNGKAIHLAVPSYPAVAKNLGLRGEVRVQVLIDENGNVVSATAVSGHALLRSSAISAARSSTFTPTTLSNQKVKVSGVIIYNFS